MLSSLCPRSSGRDNREAAILIDFLVQQTAVQTQIPAVIKTLSLPTPLVKTVVAREATVLQISSPSIPMDFSVRVTAGRMSTVAADVI